MTAKFLTKREVMSQREKSRKNAEIAVEKRYSKKLTVGVGKAFLRASMRIWGCGAVTAVSRLNSELAEQFMYGWLHRDQIAGVLVKRGLEPGQQIPLFLQSKSLAYHLIDDCSYWVDFNEVEKELNND